MSEPNTYDLIIIGAGPGGYVAAIRAAQLGMRVVVVEKRATLGGVCLNEGCIPSKALLDSSELFSLAVNKFALHGIAIDTPQLNLDAMMLRKDDVVKKLTDGIAYLFKKKGIEHIHGAATLKGKNASGQHQVEVQQDTSTLNRTVLAPSVILATGSEPAQLPGIHYDGQIVVSSREALCFDKLPDHVIVAGGGYIGLELGSVWRRLGSQVTVMEMLPNILSGMDRQAADAIYRSLRKQGIQFKLATRITAVRRLGSKAIVQFNTGTGSEEIDCDKLLVAVGRRPLTTGLGLEELGVDLDEKGRIKINSDYQTSVLGVYAVGDLVPGPMLAHKASEEGVVCVERMAGHHSAVEYETIPGVVYTWPEGASVGQTEDQLKESGIMYKVGKFNFAALGRSRCMDETEGFVKILAHTETDRVLGGHIVGPRASDLIAEVVAVMSFGGTARDIALTCHAHPTLSEAIREAALDVNKAAIHA